MLNKLTNDMEKWQHLSHFERYLLTQLWGYTTDEYKYKILKPKTIHNRVRYAYLKGMALNTFFSLNHYHESRVNFFKKCRLDIINYAKWNAKTQLQRSQKPMKFARPVGAHQKNMATTGRKNKIRKDNLY